MSRTALMRLVRRTYQISRLSVQTQCSPSQIEASLQGAVSRRQVLGGLAAIGIAGLRPKSDLQPLAQQPFPAKFNDRQPSAPRGDDPVLIVGAGIAGLTAAYRLQQAGVPIDVIEASHRIGGRLVSLTNFPGSLGTVELGGEFIDSHHTHVRRLATELGLELADLRAADAGLEREILFFQGQRVSETKVIEEFAPLSHRINADLETLNTRNITYHEPSPHAIQLDRMSLTEYLEAEPISPLIKQLVQVAYVTEFGRDPDSQSCLNMLFLIGAEVGKWSTYGLSDERYHVVGGNDQIPKKLAEKLNSCIVYGTVLESIRASDGGYRVSLRQDGTSRERNYSRVLLTVPFSVLRQVELAVDLPPVKRQAISELGYGTASKLAVPFRERIWRTRYGCTISVYTDMDFQNTWESARYNPGPGGWVTDLRGGQQGVLLAEGSPDDQAKGLSQDLEAIFPGISRVSRGRALRAIWAAEPYALGSYSCYLPGQWTQFGGVEAERAGNLWFAGEHCSLGSQGYMNGACETGEAAAQSILADLGVLATVS
ncbi:MAG: FAD-dependent oxidoreductase [Leptolyngbya sp. IPPAS B-1204]|nr:FAD-dependent oxidoreductase [Elainella sp. C42_A2020_010]RNJ66065.1 MAG: NAD(P)/FAD-dependent oxidoreductase [Leptolyngbya sp. IPPAS B-1204]